MISRYAVWLNNQSLADIDPQIYVSDISYQAVSLERDTARLAGGDGKFSGTKDYIQQNRIAIGFVVREYNTVERQDVVQRVIEWASHGGWLKTSDRPHQRIYVVCSRLPNVGSVLRWLDGLSVEFTAYDYPLWQDEIPNTVIVSRGDTETAYLRGVRQACVEAEITANAAISELTVACGDTEIALNSLNIVADDVVAIRYTDEHHILEIMHKTSVGSEVEWTSVLNKRTSESSDDLIAYPGANTLSYNADGDSACKFILRGVYV